MHCAQICSQTPSPAGKVKEKGERRRLILTKESVNKDGNVTRSRESLVGSRYSPTPKRPTSTQESDNTQIDVRCWSQESSSLMLSIAKSQVWEYVCDVAKARKTF